MNTNRPAGQTPPPCSPAPPTEKSGPPAPPPGASATAVYPGGPEANAAIPGGTPPVPAPVPVGPGASAALPPAVLGVNRAAISGAAAPAAGRREAFTATRADGVMALWCLVMGFLFMRWVLPFAGWGVSAFTGLFCGGVLLYARAKGVPIAKASWYWLAIVLLTGLCYALWPPSNELHPWQNLLLLGAAVYWCGSLFGVLLGGKTGNDLPLDMLNAGVLLPARNLDSIPRSAAALAPGRRRAGVAARRAGPVVLGLVLCVPLLVVVLPLLARADSGVFGRILREIALLIRGWNLWGWAREEVRIAALQMVFGVPAALYFCGLLGGMAHKRYSRSIDAAKTRRMLQAAAQVPLATVCVVLGMLAALYILFIACQLPRFFSAFGGVKPAEYPVYSAYAREGFFELCAIAGINLSVLAAGNGFCRVPMRQSGALRRLNVALCALTLLVIATAFSKMALYIAVQGLTPKRVMTCVFMLFLAGVCAAVAALQFRRFSVVRFAAVYGAGLLCALCLCNLDYAVMRGNAALYLQGKLPVFDEVILRRSGPAGALGAEPVRLYYENWPGPGAPEPEMLDRFYYAATMSGHEAFYTEGTARDCLTNAAARALPLPYDAEDEVWERLVEAFYRQFDP